MSINNRYEANKYYDIINELIDEFIDKWKVKPTRLKRYLKPGTKRFDNFLIKNGLKDIKGAERVLKDVIEDRVSLEKDNVMTFEKYNIFESDMYQFENPSEILYLGLGNATSEMEKHLADYYDTNLSNIDLLDTRRRKFKVSSWERENKEVIIYSIEDLNIVKGNMVDYYFELIKNKKLKVSEEIEIDILSLIDKESFYKIMNEKLSLDNEIFLNYISKILNGNKLDQKAFDDSFIIWEI